MKKEVVRMCVVTREKHLKKDLIRIVKNKDNEVFVDSLGKLNGKGAYIKKDIEVLKKARTSNVLDKILEIQIPLNIYSELERIIGG